MPNFMIILTCRQINIDCLSSENVFYSF